MIIAFSHIQQANGPSNYEKWLSHFGGDIRFIALNEYPKEDYSSILQTCSGLVFTGGADVHPARYGMEHRIAECKTEPERDEREILIQEIALNLNIPILSICRGEQFFAVIHGASLIIDIPTDVGNEHQHHQVDSKDGMHPIIIEPRTLVHKLIKTEETIVNSAHHQAVTMLPDIFIASSKAPDGIIESIEWSDPTGKPFFLGVQWHPERMDYDSPSSSEIARHFLMEAESYSLLLRS
jgi:putative glutamine amidotransferase